MCLPKVDPPKVATPAPPPPAPIEMAAAPITKKPAVQRRRGANRANPLIVRRPSGIRKGGGSGTRT